MDVDYFVNVLYFLERGTVLVLLRAYRLDDNWHGVSTLFILD